MVWLKFSKEWGIEAASTWEGIQLDETAVGSMGIEWSSGVALSGAAAAGEVGGDW